MTQVATKAIGRIGPGRGDMTDEGFSRISVWAPQGIYAAYPLRADIRWERNWGTRNRTQGAATPGNNAQDEGGVRRSVSWGAATWCMWIDGTKGTEPCIGQIDLQCAAQDACAGYGQAYGEGVEGIAEACEVSEG